MKEGMIPHAAGSTPSFLDDQNIGVKKVLVAAKGDEGGEGGRGP